MHPGTPTMGGAPASPGRREIKATFPIPLGGSRDNTRRQLCRGPPPSLASEAPSPLCNRRTGL